MELKHIGIRPKGKVITTESRNVITYFEEFEDGGGRWWTTRMLRSGCGGTMCDYIIKEGLVHCDFCMEWFALEQFEET